MSDPIVVVAYVSIGVVEHEIDPAEELYVPDAHGV